MRLVLLIFCFYLFPLAASSQKEKREKKDPYTSTELWAPIPIDRQLAHDKLDRLQRKADESDGVIDGVIHIDNDSTATSLLTTSVLKEADRIQIVVENLPLDKWTKIRTIENLEKSLRDLVYDLQNKKADARMYANIVRDYWVLFMRNQDGQPITGYIDSNFSRSFDVLKTFFREDTPSVQMVYKHMVKEYPDEMFKRFREFSWMPAAEELFAWLAPQNPSLILTYATSTSAERSVTRRCKDPLVKKIVEIADKTNIPLRAIVYLDDLMQGSITIPEINQVISVPELYYKSLVKQRLRSASLTKKIRERESKLQALEYVRTMNELHDSPDPVRFKCIENLSPQEMYFLMVLCSDEIYTSTFVGTFNRMLLKMAPQKGDLFLQDLNNDKFRTFIRMCAGYNKLDEFLATIDGGRRNAFMAAFVNFIDKNTDTDLEDAVDIADSFGSINDPELLEYLRGQVLENYERTYREDNIRGLTIYFLLHTLCSTVINPEESSEDLQKQLKVPPITYVPFKNLGDSTGRIIEQVFFYGDEDGKISFASFQGIFKADEWKVEKNEQWISLQSLKGKPITIYANLPLEEPLDEEAQKALCAYLDKNAIRPGIIVHRGHSYHLPTTMSHISASNKIIILGSCGGYHNLSTILGQSEDAHIISSKQTGSMQVNDPILRDIQQLLLNGQDINWISLWNTLSTEMNSPRLQDLFNDYVPPHKNMGALFLKAFKIQMAQQGS
ncbi:MAG TPA: hypothetical protein PLP14_00400 [Chitinophagaceae bacterium]|nr:hypothetical protein [Chitinophagaceae bacterium]